MDVPTNTSDASQFCSWQPIDCRGPPSKSAVALEVSGAQSWPYAGKPPPRLASAPAGPNVTALNLCPASHSSSPV